MFTTYVPCCSGSTGTKMISVCPRSCTTNGLFVLICTGTIGTAFRLPTRQSWTLTDFWVLGTYGTTEIGSSGSLKRTRIAGKSSSPAITDGVPTAAALWVGIEFESSTRGAPSFLRQRSWSSGSAANCNVLLNRGLPWSWTQPSSSPWTLMGVWRSGRRGSMNWTTGFVVKENDSAWTSGRPTVLRTVLTAGKIGRNTEYVFCGASPESE